MESLAGWGKSLTGLSICERLHVSNAHSGEKTTMIWGKCPSSDEEKASKQIVTYKL